VSEYPGTGFLDLCGLGARAAGAALRGPRSFDPGRVLHDWLRQLTVRHGSANVRLNIPGMPLLLVTDRELSGRILAAPPRRDGFSAGTPKRKGMSFLAPGALTVAEDEAWTRLRPFNERVLCAGGPHRHQRAFLGRVRRAFAEPPSSVSDLRSQMGRAMLDIVFGEGVAPAGLASEIRELFGLVQNPLKRRLAGARACRGVAQLYESLRDQWRRSDGASADSLLGMAKAGPAGENEETLLQQVPHWMFTFNGSGADLLTRGLAMIGSRPDVLGRVRRELADAGPLDEPDAIGQLGYLEACLLEAARLYPPVRFTFHRAGGHAAAGETRIPAGTEILQVFSLAQRDRAFDPTADDFRPERWSEPGSRAEAAYPNLFLSGARRCPGRDLILFVCKGAAACLLVSGLEVRSERLARDPVPFTFPEKRLAFVRRS
jgi:cytochrome P450